MNLKTITAHHWLRHKYQKSFHVYLSMSPGSLPLCGQLPCIVNFKDLDLPSNDSPTCKDCGAILFGFDLRVHPNKFTGK